MQIDLEGKVQIGDLEIMKITILVLFAVILGFTFAGGVLAIMGWNDISLIVGSLTGGLVFGPVLGIYIGVVSYLNGNKLRKVFPKVFSINPYLPSIFILLGIVVFGYIASETDEMLIAILIGFAPVVIAFLLLLLTHLFARGKS